MHIHIETVVAVLIAGLFLAVVYDVIKHAVAVHKAIKASASDPAGGGSVGKSDGPSKPSTPPAAE